MRCPNCGNENPDDYTFCDECGAKLTAQDGEAASMPAPPPMPAAEPGFTPVSTMSGPAEGAGAASPNGTSEGENASGPMPAGGVCPNCGAATVPGEAYCNECGAELPTTATTVSEAGAPGGMDGAAQEPAGAAPGMGDLYAQGPEGMPGGPMPEMPPPPMGDHDYEAAMPVSEDTMGAATMEGPGLAPMAPTEPEMPGVMPMPGADSEPLHMEAVPMAAAGAAPAYADAAADTRGWATNALGQLEDAQQAMARGDWAAYGQSMSTLKSFLESVAQGAAPSMTMPMPAMPAAPTMPAPPAMTPGADVSGMPPAPGMADMVSQQPAAEPAYAAAQSMGARLVVISTGAEMPLPQQEEITVGREDPSSGIFPDIDLTPYGGEDGGVSRRHARMLHVGNDYFIEDLQSTNYTKLDGQRLPARVREKLEDGARIDFGRVAVIFRKS